MLHATETYLHFSEKADGAAVTYPAKGMFVGRPQSLFSPAVSFFLFLVNVAGVAAVGALFASTSGFCLSCAMYRRFWLTSAGRSAGIPTIAQSVPDNVSFAAGLQPQHSNIAAWMQGRRHLAHAYSMTV